MPSLKNESYVDLHKGSLLSGCSGLSLEIKGHACWSCIQTMKRLLTRFAITIMCHLHADSEIDRYMYSIHRLASYAVSLSIIIHHGPQVCCSHWLIFQACLLVAKSSKGIGIFKWLPLYSSFTLACQPSCNAATLMSIVYYYHLL